MSAFHHATALVIGEKGLLLLGGPGAGKSALAERLIAEAQRAGHFARLIGDDRVAVARVGKQLVASGHPVTRGKIERRGIGIVLLDHIDRAVLVGVVDIASAPVRLPVTPVPRYALEGHDLPLLTLRDDRDLAAKAHLVLDWLNL